MESILINGRYTIQEAEQLLAKIFKVKTDFQIAKIDTSVLSEEDIKHCEKRVNELEHDQRAISRLLTQSGYKHVALHAKLTLEFCPDYHNS
ncbi:MAG: hypothetical protein JSS82_02295 [Bacteroidetes bacterium]|nr:hypothetical protein [Bacteroidota bacterium]